MLQILILGNLPKQINLRLYINTNHCKNCLVKHKNITFELYLKAVAPNNFREFTVAVMVTTLRRSVVLLGRPNAFLTPSSTFDLKSVIVHIEMKQMLLTIFLRIWQAFMD